MFVHDFSVCKNLQMYGRRTIGGFYLFCLFPFIITMVFVNKIISKISRNLPLKDYIIDKVDH